MPTFNCTKFAEGLREMQDQRSKIQDRFLNLKKKKESGNIDLLGAREILPQCRFLRKLVAQSMIEFGWNNLSNYRKAVVVERWSLHHQELTATQLAFVYQIDPFEIDSRVERAVVQKVEKVIESRNKRKDYAVIFNVEERQVIDNLSNLQPDTRAWVGSEDTVCQVSAGESLEKVLELGKVFGLKVDLTEATWMIKQQLTDWNGTIIDTGNAFNYPKLRRVGGSIQAMLAKHVFVNSLIWVGCGLDFHQVEPTLSLPVLRKAIIIQAMAISRLDAPLLERISTIHVREPRITLDRINIPEKLKTHVHWAG